MDFTYHFKPNECHIQTVIQPTGTFIVNAIAQTVELIPSSVNTHINTHDEVNNERLESTNCPVGRRSLGDML